MGDHKLLTNAILDRFVAHFALDLATITKFAMTTFLHRFSVGHVISVTA